MQPQLLSCLPAPEHKTRENGTLPAANGQITSEEVWDCIVVGGGPAGLSAALILGRARRRVLILDSGEKRNEASLVQHAILGADGFDRREFLDRARQQVLAYPTISLHSLAVCDIDVKAGEVQRVCDGAEPGCHSVLKTGERITETDSFVVHTEDGKKVLRSPQASLDQRPSPGRLAGFYFVQSNAEEIAAIAAVWAGRGPVRTYVPISWASGNQETPRGPLHQAPTVSHVALAVWGRSIWVCLYCDAYEYTDKPMGAYGNGERGVHIAFEMLLWSSYVTLFTDGEELDATELERKLLQKHGITVIETPIARAVGNGSGQLAGLVLADSSFVPLSCLFFNTGRVQSSLLPEKMGLPADVRGDIVCETKGNVQAIHGLYVAGNCAAAPLKLVMTAASQGSITGAKVNSELLYEELGLDEDEGSRYICSLEGSRTSAAQCGTTHSQQGRRNHTATTHPTMGKAWHEARATKVDQPSMQ